MQFVATLALVVAQGATPMPQEFKGVWTTASGQAVIINSTHSLQTMIGDRHLAAWNIGQVPDGTFLGVWRATRKMLPTGERIPRGQDSSDYVAMYGTVKGPLSAPLPFKTAVPAEYGEVRLSVGVVDAYRRIQSLKIVVSSAEKTVRMSESLYSVMPVESISLGGSFSDGKISVKLDDSGGRNGQITGTLSYLGASYIVKGTRTEGRAYIRLGDASNDRVMGDGYVEWNPSPGRMRELQGKSSSTTDRLIIGIRTGDQAADTITDHIISRQ